MTEPMAALAAGKLDRDKIETFLHQKLGIEEPLQITPIAGGQSNPTFILSYPGRKLVLRKRPAGDLLPSAHAVDREYRIMSALADSGVPVPKMLLFHAEPDIVGTAFYVMDFMEGRVFHDVTLPGVSPADRKAMFLSAAETLAKLHGVEVAAVGLGDFGRPAGYFQRQVARWSRQWDLSKSEDDEDVDRLRSWLEANIPPEDGRATIVHGDYRIGNLMFHPHEPRVVAVLDWELATLGDSLADLAHFCAFTWHMRGDEYGGVMDADLAQLGIPGEAEFCAAYYANRGDAPQLARFHIIFALFRTAIIFAGIAARAKAGNAAADNAETVGKLAGVLTARAVGMLED